MRALKVGRLDKFQCQSSSIPSLDCIKNGGLLRTAVPFLRWLETERRGRTI